MNLLSRLLGSRPFSGKPPARPGAALYSHALKAARRVEFYHNGPVADTVDGRFDLLVAHVFLLIRRLDQDQGQQLSQSVFDAMFADMDDSLREMGTSDTAVGKRIKEMAKVFYGRAGVYGAAMDAGDGEALALAVHRNLLGGDTAKLAAANALAGYFKACEKALNAQSVNQITQSGPCYPPFASQP